jgi:hypothetical protein
MTPPVSKTWWLAWNWIFFGLLAVSGLGLFIGFSGDKPTWERVAPLCWAVAVAAVLTVMRVIVSGKRWKAALAVTLMTMIAVLVIVAVMLWGPAGWANRVDWLIPLLLVGYSQCSRWYEEPKSS